MSVLQSLLGLEGKAALVIGAGQGMGEASSLALAAAGCDVAILDSVTERAEHVAGRVRQLGTRAEALVADVLNECEIERAVAEAARRFPRLEKLVTIVGSASWGTLLEMSAETWDREHAINVRYVFLAARAFARSQIARGLPGAITCISSVDGVQAAPNHAAYGAAKAGLVHLVRSMAVEWAPHGIRVNSVAPGTIATPRLAGRPERAADGDRVPMRRRGTPEEIATTVLFLSSELASYVTGETVFVDGGWMASNILYPPQ